MAVCLQPRTCATFFFSLSRRRLFLILKINLSFVFVSFFFSLLFNDLHMDTVFVVCVSVGINKREKQQTIGSVARLMARLSLQDTNYLFILIFFHFFKLLFHFAFYLLLLLCRPTTDFERQRKRLQDRPLFSSQLVCDIRLSLYVSCSFFVFVFFPNSIS